jgi:dethiobiotin synthetase
VAPRGVFVSGTGTGVGKTAVAAALARALVARGERVAAIKPIETGVDGAAADAVALSEACGRPELAHDRRWIRARLPASP